jgi:hypothetical protein
MVRRLAVVIVSAAALTCSLDPVHDEAAADLGPEAPGVAPGPMHRAGQPCLVCHSGGAANPEMSVGGTVYQVRGADAPLAGASVELIDANGSIATATTNAVGNFYIEPSRWQPAFPLQVNVSFGEVTATMNSIIGRDGSCATCHADPPSRISAGRVYLAQIPALLPDAGAP